MANTTNYNWETPDDTDLVKDGAAAIRTLGSSIDTTTKALNPSTTLGDIEYRSSTANTNARLAIGSNGQILGVSAGVPAWINNDQGDITEVQAGTGISVASGTGPIPVITNTVATEFDAKGDLVVGTGADTFDKLTVGANDTILVADSSTATGLKWAAPASGGGMTLLSTTALTGASITLSSISTAYTNLYLVLKNVYLATAGGNCSMQLNGDTGSNYSYSYIRYREATVGVGYNYSANEHGFLFEASASSSASKLTNCEVVLPRYTDTDTQPIYSRSYGSNATQVINYTSVGSYDSSAAITEIKLTPQYNFSGGTAYLYGVK
jgi:hypothetical protein